MRGLAMFMLVLGIGFTIVIARTMHTDGQDLRRADRWFLGLLFGGVGLLFMSLGMVGLLR